MTDFVLLSGLGHAMLVVAGLLVYVMFTRIDHQRRHRHPRRQHAQAVGQQQLDGLLGLRVEGGGYPRPAGGARP